jgi:hypothetical protein
METRLCYGSSPQHGSDVRAQDTQLCCVGAHGTKPDSIVGANRNQALVWELIETRLCCGSSWNDGSGLGAQGNPLYWELMETQPGARSLTFSTIPEI